MTTQANEPPDKYKRSKCAFGSWQNAIQAHNYDQIREDYLSCNFTIQQLVEKYDVKERSLLWFVRTKWKKLLIADGKTPPAEPKLTFKSKPPAFWKDLEIEYRHGASVKELAVKYNIHPITIAKKMSKEGWVIGKKALPGWGARSMASPQEMGIRMENFALSVRNHVERTLVVLEKYADRQRGTVNANELDRIAAAMNIISKSFAAIVETGLKLYKFTVMSHEAEEEVYAEGRQASSKKAMEAGMKAPVKPNKMAVPIRIERPGGNVVDLRHGKHGNNGRSNTPFMEYRIDVNPGEIERPQDRTIPEAGVLQRGVSEGAQGIDGPESA